MTVPKCIIDMEKRTNLGRTDAQIVQNLKNNKTPPKCTGSDKRACIGSAALIRELRVI